MMHFILKLAQKVAFFAPHSVGYLPEDDEKQENNTRRLASEFQTFLMCCPEPVLASQMIGFLRPKGNLQKRRLD
jgi:hypothetical protein